MTINSLFYEVSLQNHFEKITRKFKNGCLCEDKVGTWVLERVSVCRLIECKILQAAILRLSEGEGEGRRSLNTPEQIHSDSSLTDVFPIACGQVLGSSRIFYQESSSCI
jgi:hypothetical protein